MFRVDTLDGTDDQGLEGKLNSALSQRWTNLLDIQADLIRFGTTQGFTVNQIRGALQDLFDTFSTEWFSYLVAATDALPTAITNDATLTWLDLDASGQTIRTRLVNRLT